MWHDEVSHLTCWTKQFGGGEEMEKEREKREKKKNEREAPTSL